MYQKNKQQNNHQYSDKFVSAAIRMLSLSSRVEHYMSSSLKKSQLTLPQFNVLRVLALNHPNPLVLKELTDKMIDKSSNTSRLVDKLDDKKLVQRQTSSSDRRIIHISLTEEGLALMAKANEKLESSIESCLSSGEYTGAENIIESLQNLQNIG